MNQSLSGRAAGDGARGKNEQPPSGMEAVTVGLRRALTEGPDCPDAVASPDPCVMWEPGIGGASP